jgi:hypothetical protein
LVNPDLSVLNQLNHQAKQLSFTLKKMSEEQSNSSYAEGKWSVKDIVQHIIDVERVFVYRAVRFSRKDKSPLPFFDENAFANAANANRLSVRQLIQ